MSKISQIEAELKTIEQGKFQKLCNLFLVQKFRLKIKSEGSAKGTDKTKTGTPDSFAVLANGNFIFIEYTTQQTGICKKFLEDLEKNFDETKTGVPINKIEKIFLCYNSQLNPEETNKIINFCFSKNKEVEFIDLDYLKFELYGYPRLAKDFLNIESDTEQILSPDDFIKDLEKKGTTLSNEFFARETELDKLGRLLISTDIIVINGRSGTGKTRIAKEAIQNFLLTQKDYETFCILTKGQPLYYDLQAYFLAARKYIVLVDDANRIGDFLAIARLTKSEKCKVKILITVRDYAFEKIKNQLKKENHSYETLELNPLPDDIVKKILKSMNVTNPMCVKNITRIADGNPRLIMMSAEHALVDNDCNKLNDVTDIYNNFFEPITSNGELKDKKLLSVLGIICFFRTINKNQEKLVNHIYESFNINENDFWENVFKLHDLEFVNLYEKHVVKIADQVLANYFFYFVFIKNKTLDFSIILNDYLSEFKGKIKENLYPILEHFGYQKILTILSPILDNRLELIRDNEEELIDFFEVFGFYKQENILLFIHDKIEQIPNQKITQYQFRRQETNDGWTRTEKEYPLLKLLILFGQSPNDHFVTSLDLLFQYVRKHPSILPEVIQYIETTLIFDEESHNHGYWIQTKLFDFLLNKIDEGEDYQLYVGVLFEIAPHFLRTSFRLTKGGRKRATIVLYNIRLQKTPEIESLRKKIFDSVFSYYSELEEKVLQFLENYFSRREDSPQNEIYKYDSEFIFSFIQSSLNPEIYKHCQIAHQYLNFLDSLDIKKSESQSISKKFQNERLNLSKVLTYKYRTWVNEENQDRGTKKYQEHNKNRLEKYFNAYSMPQYYSLIEEVDFIVKNNSDENHTISASLELILLNILEYSPQDCYLVIEHLFKIKNPYGFYSFKIIHDLVQQISVEKIYNLFNEYDFTNKQQWKLNFFMSLTTEQITSFYKDELLSHFSNLQNGIYLPLKFLKNYKSKDYKIYKKVFEILMDKEKNENFRFDFFAEDLFENHFTEFKDDLDLIKEIYINLSLKPQSAFDVSGKHFKKIYQLDSNFIIELILGMASKKPIFRSENISFHFHFVWELTEAETIIDDTIRIVNNKDIYFGDNHIASKFFPSNGFNERINNFIKGYIKKYFNDRKKMKAIFSIIHNCYPDKRIFYLKELLIYYTDLELLYSLPLASSGFSGVRSNLIPYYEEQIEFWKLVLPIFSGKVKFLKHRQWVNGEIKHLRDWIARDLERDFIDDY